MRTDLVASLIEEEDFCASLGKTLYKIPRWAERNPFGIEALNKVEVIVEFVERAVAERLDHAALRGNAAAAMRSIQAMRQSIIASTTLPAEDRDACWHVAAAMDERARSVGGHAQHQRAAQHPLDICASIDARLG